MTFPTPAADDAPYRRTLARDSLPLLRGALAERYEIEREVGRGGMATVYLARDLRHERRVALKVLRSHLAAAMGPERFLREIRYIARLQHPHILPLYDSGEVDGALFYVMPWIAGESLRSLIARGPVPLVDALRITAEVADALDHAHENNVVHRDIKPENILLSGGHAIVSDFGIARAIARAGSEETLTQLGFTIGTPAYMSPEQAEALPEIDGRSDVYSLACVTYEMLAGAPAYTGPTTQAILAGHMRGPPRAFGGKHGVPKSVDEALARALARQPSARFPTAGEFAAALARGLDGAALLRTTRPAIAPTFADVRLATSAPTALVGRASSARSRAPVLVLAVAVLALVLLAWLLNR